MEVKEEEGKEEAEMVEVVVLGVKEAVELEVCQVVEAKVVGVRAEGGREEVVESEVRVVEEQEEK